MHGTVIAFPGIYGFLHFAFHRESLSLLGRKDGALYFIILLFLNLAFCETLVEYLQRGVRPITACVPRPVRSPPWRFPMLRSDTRSSREQAKGGTDNKYKEHDQGADPPEPPSIIPHMPRPRPIPRGRLLSLLRKRQR